MKTTTLAIGITALLTLYGCGGGGSSSAVSGSPPNGDSSTPDDTQNPQPDSGEEQQPAPDALPDSGGDKQPAPDTQPDGDQDPQPVPTPAPVTDPTPDPAPVTDPTPDPAPVTDPTPAPAPVADPTPDPAPSPTTGAGIDMTRAFSQQVDCKYGIKPYYEAADSGLWIASFDGDNFSLQSANGAKTFGGTFLNSGNAVDRQDFASAALYRTYLGASGGEIYFTKTVSEQIIAAGHNKFGGTNPRADTVECGDGTEATWIAPPAQSPITATDSAIAFSNGSIEMNCALRQGDAPFNEPRQMRAYTTQAGAVSMLIGGREFLFQIPDFNGADRTVTMPVSSGKLSPGGVRIYESANASGDKITINLRYDNLVSSIRETRANGQLVNCVPNPLEPRF